ncbi:1-phosphatidylinositol 4,5-bisphosphate phosphodiesterase eta-1 isoform X2 [Corvus moneduloides]|uniref:1-phosphatidylinositol 4,5-bisphosphate phosphodiesterase eta-1 isoform X2 n=1 Tax=Corvus moneduloides TaxID=1196302 RepID=UPI0013634F96|nr:1-phosphatidylinositol 4,5-bisphosphate phosphodiesterase eta-1 isoform X2 [Corvus moneduloides]XP_031975813.1 1-phosphatidylinositol 4,5-bisphosphate phosphodiesterase eta-1 isoform X2 [Corvus moneduloides]XP_031975814.1 1-phosphatidylinositol 4,5-bisphosphate phosphodiesterase eta-1 isoform X2 [Corvus moneduloides]
MSYWSLDKKSCLQYCRHFLADNGVFHVERCMSVMQSGTQMVKLKSGTKGLVRLFYLDEHRTCIRWRPSRKSEKAKIVIDSIYKVSEGRQSEIFHRHAEGSFDPSCCFTIYHGNHLETLDLITSNPEEARTWITGLKYLMAGISDEDSLAKRQRTHNHWVKQTFEEADKNGDGLLNIEEIHQLMHKLNVNLPRRKVRQMFQEADTDENQGTLNFEEFSVFYKMMSLRRDLYLLLLSYSDKKDHLTAEELAQFLKVEQKMNNVTPEYCLDIIQKFEVSEENKKQNVLGIEGFTSFMRSPVCEVSNPLHREVHQDMEQPLCHYFIASSHNTYLSGDQLLSQSRAEMYARVLQAGCRCVEVDCWDGPDGEPVVHHGYTLTSKILFRDVAETINKYAFIKNEFPVILSIENHCSIQQQKKIAQYLKEIFGDKLDLSSVSTGDRRQLPSPQDLKGKILVKGKKLPCSLGADAEEGEVSEEDSADEIEDDCKLKPCFGNGATQHQVESFIRTKLESLLKESQIRDKEDPDSFTVRALLKATHQSFNVNLKQLEDSKQNLDTKEGGKKSHGRSLMGNFGKHKRAAKAAGKAHGASDDEDSQQHPPGKEPGQPHRLARRRKTVKLCRALSDLVVYTNSVAAQDIVDDGSTGNVLSFSETRAHQAVQQKAEQFMLYNQRQLTRVYPSAYRIDSSNFNPVPYWNVGCQLVALNYQSEGRVMQLNEAKFRVNGNCGYVLKPQQMCKGTFNPYSADPLPASPKKQLILKIISGQQLPKPPDSMLGDRGEIIDPFVEVEIIGLPVDCCKDQTRVVDDNGFNPVWEETLTFTIHMPEIALVRFLVWDHDPIGRDFVGQRTVAFSSLVPGYRHVYLEGLTEASLFVHIIINETYGKWSPLILNPSYTIMHFLGATKSKQLIGLRGLFSKAPKAGAAEASGHHVRKRSIGERILRRTASAPAKGRKKSKMGFLEAAEMKDSTSEPTDLKDKEGVVRRPNRSWQARPASMPVDRFLMVELPCPAEDTAQEAKAEENTFANSDDNTNGKETSLKELVLPCSEQKANALNLASQFKKENDQRDSTADSLVPPPQEQPEHLLFANGVAQANHLMDYQENNLSDGAVPLMQDSDSELPTEKSHHKSSADSKKEDDTKGSKEGKIALMGTSLSQKAEVEDHKYNMRKSTAAPLSLTDTSSAVCSEDPDCHPTVALQDSDISHLIDEVSLSTESELDSAVSALIGQFDGTNDQTPLPPVSSPHGSSSQTHRRGAALPHVLAADLSSPCRHNFTPTKSSKSPLFSTPDTAMFSSLEDAEYSTYAIIHEASPASECNSHRELVCKERLNSLENNLPGSPCSSSLSMLNANPKRNCGTKSGPSWGAPECASSFGSSGLIFEEALGPAVTGEHSDSSSLVEVDGDSQDLLVTACEYRREDMSQLASPLRLRQKQDPGHGGDRTSGSSTTAGLCAAARHCSKNFRTAGSQLPFPSCENAGFLCQQHSEKHKDAVRAPQLSSACPLLPGALPFPPHPAIQQSSPCKSKSLGDLTSEDISCNFESKYQYISRSFISSGLRDRKAAATQGVRPHSTDALTEQLRKLLSLEQEDSRESLCSRQMDEDCSRALVRKLSSRSQSRVRNIASRARERQEAAGKPRPCDGSGVGGVVLRNKAAGPPHAANRHSTGSCIGRYLHGCPGERRGAPEGACSALQRGCGDGLCGHGLCGHGPGLRLPPGAQEQPEVYFLLRL